MIEMTITGALLNNSIKIASFCEMPFLSLFLPELIMV